MAESNVPVLVAVGGDLKRQQWLNHHVTSHWPDARVTSITAGQLAAATRLLKDVEPDAVILQVDFSTPATETQGISIMLSLMQARRGLYCILLADNGTEWAAVRALKSGASDYLPLASVTRETLLAAISEAVRRHREAALAASRIVAEEIEAHEIEVPGYTIVKEIATSNFSSVYLARSERLRRNIVLKVMKRNGSGHEREDAERFQREYEIISSVTHRSIAEIYDFGTLPHHLYLAMEYFPCGDLRERLRNPISVEEALYYLRKIAEALRVIHVFGILHRDLKPANVMLREDNSPVLIDFGLARREMDNLSVTGIGQVLGSPYYISPEQALGHQVDSRTDLYSLGVMFFEMLTGERPYTGMSAMAIMAQQASSPVPRLPPALAAQQTLIDRLMAKNVAERYTSADELLADLSPLTAEVA
jgi:DNA-binding NarL/FixJ family response regulator